MHSKPPKLLIATDLDGTLLDHHDYTFNAAQPALQLISEQQIPLLLNTSKTQAEVEQIRQQLGNQHPFIVENGAGIVLPINYFHELNDPQLELLEQKGDYLLKTVGSTLQQVLALLAESRISSGFHFRGFSEMDVDEVVQLTGLNNEQALHAKTRLFSEPIIWLDDEEKLASFTQHLHTIGLQIVRGGRFFHISGGGNKGSALSWLIRCFAAQWQETAVLIAAGDGQNDITMLEIADYAVVVRSPTNPTLQLPHHPAVTITEYCGPLGWNDAMLNLIEQQLTNTQNKG